MTFHHVAPSKSFFLTEKNLCFKNFLFKKFFFLIVLAVFSNACSSSSSDSSSGSSGDSSSSSNDQKKADSPSKKPQVSVSSCTITQFQDETGKTQAIAAMKDLEREQTLKFFYDCNIAKKDYNKKATLAVSGNTAITTSVTEINIPAQAKATGSFSVTGLKTANTNVPTSIKIKLEKSDVLTQLALTVTPTFALNPNKVKIEIATSLAALTATSGIMKKLEVYQNKLYLLDATGSRSDSYAKFYSSSDGENWQDLGEPEDNGQKIVASFFDTTVHDGKLWVADYDKDGFRASLWNFDGKWNRVGVGKGTHRYFSLVSFQNTLYQILGDYRNWAYDGSQWKNTFTGTKDIARINAVVFDGKIWIIGGREYKNVEGKTTAIALQTVATSDGTNYQDDAASLPKKSWWAAVEIFPRGLLAIGGLDNNKKPVPAVFYSRFGKTWKEITGIKDQSELQGVFAGATAVYKGALWAVNNNKKILKITYEE